MGNEQSQQYNSPGGVTQQGVRVGAHSGIPNDTVPYAGGQLQYCFVNVEAKLTTQATFFSAPVVTTNVDAYYSIISQPYAQGFVMNQFQSIPGVQRQKGFSFSVGMPFQAILSRPVNAPPPNERWQLRVEKSFLQTQQVLQFFTTQSSVVSNTSDIYQKINQVASQGGRLICIEITGFEQGPSFGQSFSGYQGIKGVDLFFNMPLHPNPTVYIYQAISVPVQFQVTSSFPQPRIQVLTDFMGQFAAFLQKGWKLVEINFDCSMTTQPGFFQAHSSLNSIWFFEKEASKVNSEIPEWEGTIIEYEHKITTTFSGTRAKTNWDPLVIQMGQRGWELACLVESPETYNTSFSSSAMKVLMFFQRRIMRPVGAGGFVMPPQAGVPPAQGSYPPSQGGYPPSQGSYPPAQGSYAPGPGFHPPPQGSYPPPHTGGNQPPPPYPASTAPSAYPASAPPLQGGYTPPMGAYPAPPHGGYPGSPQREQKQ
ncbi:uncharacterized protein LOC110973367 [Acanthaster planci]|uniref:Uncharacterized protein LOC110973367 n=1 Tax=Acanthaster planci TaxID=133434 RepID=A0A8B7XGC2_ACAPL|nr:uncharacterized protein LOC110973367 [Acanthaster planci]